MAELKSWPRKHYQPGGGDAQLFYKVYGRFEGEPAISRTRHRTNGVPEGCDLMSYERGTEGFEFGLDPLLSGAFERDDPKLFARTQASEQCLVLRGEIPDPETLDYFRDAIGLVTALLDSGGVSVFDPFRLKWWSAAEWKRDVFEPDGPVPRHHAMIRISDGWYATRGMLKFGRPDLSIHGVTPELREGVIDLCNRFIEMLAFGAIVPEGQPIKMQSLPEGWICSHRGSLDDPDFNNFHLEIGPAARRPRSR